LRKGTWGEIVSYPKLEGVPLPRFVEPGALTTPGNLCWLVRDGLVKEAHGEAMREDFHEFERRVELAGGPQREQSKKNKLGEPYLQKYKVDVHKRNTVAVPPWFSRVWASAPSNWREKGKGELVKIILRLARERWPEATIRAVTLHDDTSNLHFDIWATELMAKEMTIRKEKAVRYVTRNVFQSGLCGPGTMYLQAKKDLGHNLHPVDEQKLRKSLEMYAVHRSMTKKELPEVPAEIAFARKLDATLAKLFKTPDIVNKTKVEYLAHCKSLDSAKYATFDKIDEVKNKSLELNVMESDFQEKWEEVAQKEKELQQLLDQVLINDKPSLDYIIGRWEKSKSFRENFKLAPLASQKLVNSLRYFQDPELKKMVKEMEDVLATVPSIE